MQREFAMRREMVTGNFGDGVKPSVSLRIEKGGQRGVVDPPIDLSMLGFESEPRV